MSRDEKERLLVQIDEHIVTPYLLDTIRRVGRSTQATYEDHKIDGYCRKAFGYCQWQQLTNLFGRIDETEVPFEIRTHPSCCIEWKNTRLYHHRVADDEMSPLRDSLPTNGHKAASDFLSETDERVLPLFKDLAPVQWDTHIVVLGIAANPNQGVRRVSLHYPAEASANGNSKPSITKWAVSHIVWQVGRPEPGDISDIPTPEAPQRPTLTKKKKDEQSNA